MEEVAINSDRTLATVVRVLELEPIEGADRIELATVQGWKVVVKKGEFAVNDLAIYYEIGSILPKDDPNTGFLEGKPLKTRKMRGVVSQGLLGPLSWSTHYNVDTTKLKEDDDLTEELHVKKWIMDEELDLYVSDDGLRGQFPSIIRKTREDKVQKCAKKIKELEGKDVVITQKYDGTSTTYMFYKNEFLICGRNNVLLAKEAGPHYFDMATKINIEEKMKTFGKNLAIQGELIGPKIGKNRHQVLDLEFYVFNIFDIDKQYYMNWQEILDIVKIMDLKTVPVVYRGIMKEELLSSKALIELAEQQLYDNGQAKVLAEGIVIKNDYGFGYERISMKAISNKYLMKHNL